MKLRWLCLAPILAACSHSPSFTYEAAANGARTTGPVVQLTYNVEQDYWPNLTADGAGILYAFVDPVGPKHRCLGLVSPTGGTRIWEMCRHQAVDDDSTSSYPAYALSHANGRLLYLEAVGPWVDGIPTGTDAIPSETTLWLADTAAPFRRTALLSLPAFFDGNAISWLGDIVWTGPNAFITLGQYYAIARHCFGTCFPPVPEGTGLDTVLSTGTVPGAEGVILRGSIANGQATLSSVVGTEGATGYSLAEGGTSIVYTRRNDRFLYRIPLAGGSGAPFGPATSTLQPDNQLFGVSCVGTTCVVATDSVTLYRLDPNKIFALLGGGARELRSVSMITGASTTLASYSSIISSPKLSPSGDVVLQVGGPWGHLQTFAGSPQSDLFVLRGVVH